MGVTGRAGALVQNLRPKRFASHIVVVLTLSVTVGIALAQPAEASTPRPVITKTQATFTIPVSNGDSWRLRLWSSGTLEGVDIATAGTLTVPVPATADCTFQADISVAPPGSNTYWYYYPGTRATVPGCGPVSTIAGHIYACDANRRPDDDRDTRRHVGRLGSTDIGVAAEPAVGDPCARRELHHDGRRSVRLCVRRLRRIGDRRVERLHGVRISGGALGWIRRWRLLRGGGIDGARWRLQPAAQCGESDTGEDRPSHTARRGNQGEWLGPRIHRHEHRATAVRGDRPSCSWDPGYARFFPPAFPASTLNGPDPYRPRAT